MTPVSLLVKATLLLVLAAITHAALARRRSAATRHLIWMLAIASLLLLPVLAAVLPGWTAVRLPATSAPEPTAVVSSARPNAEANPGRGPVDDPGPGVAGAGLASTTASIRWPAALPLLYGLYGAWSLLLLARLVAGYVSLHRLTSRATGVTDPGWTALLLDSASRLGILRPVRLMRSPEPSIPMTWGLWRPTVLIPAIGDTWSEDRRRAVLLHELAHVARHDCLTQGMASLACALYWIHPGVWWVARRMRVEREHACDDRVLTAGAHAPDYAGHLLELAYALSGTRAPALALTMARPRQLERRMFALLDAARNRTPLALSSQLVSLAIMTALLVPVAAATSSVAPAPGDDQPLARQSLEVGALGRLGQSVTPTASQRAQPGTWEMRPTGEAGVVHLRLSERDGFHGSNIDVARLDGLPPSLVAGGEGPVRFSLRRDAGTFTFDGVMRGGVGAGTFTFAPSAAFVTELVTRGYGRPTPDDQRWLAYRNIGVDFLDELVAQGYARPSLEQLTRAAQHGVTLPYLSEMGRLGYRLGRLETLVTQRDHGVTPAFIRGLASQGLPRLSAEDLLQVRDHGVSPEYVGGLRSLGYRVVDVQQLINLRDHGVSPEFIRGLESLGFKALPLDTLVTARDHGVSPEYARELRALGYPLTLEELTRARDHGINAEYVRDLSALGYSRLTLDQMIRLRNHGVQPEYVRQLNALGYKSLAIEDLVGLRDHGITPDRVRRANARANTRLSVEQLKSSAAQGWR